MQQEMTDIPLLENSQISSVLHKISLVLNARTLFLKSVSHTSSSLTQSDKKNVMDHYKLAKNWKIGTETAKKTLKATTERGIRTMLHPTLNRRFKTNDRMFRYRGLNTDMYTDTMFASKKSLRGNNCGQIYVNDLDFTKKIPMKDRTEVPATVSQFVREEGVPITLILDGDREQIGQKVIKNCSDANCKIKRLEFETPWANRAEMGIRELKRGVRRLMRFINAPLRL